MRATMLVTTFAAAFGVTPRAHAHCAAPDIIAPLFRAGAPGDITLFMNFASARSQDGGKSWRLQCEEIYQSPDQVVGPSAQAWTPKGKILLAHFSGLLSSEDNGCSYQRASGTGEEAVLSAAPDPSDPEQHLYFVGASTLFESRDGGKTAAALHTFGTQKPVGVLVAPSDPRTVYVAAFDSGGASVSWSIHVSTDGGKTFQENKTGLTSDSFTLSHVAANDPKRVYAIVRTDAGQRLWRFDDGGAPASMHAVFDDDDMTDPGVDAVDRALSVTAGATPAELWVGLKGNDRDAAGGRLYHSTDAGDHWQAVAGSQPHFRCVAFAHGKLWGCGNNLVAGDAFALGSSADSGASWQKVFAFGELCTALECATAVCAPIFASQCTPGLCSAGSGGTAGAGGAGAASAAGAGGAGTAGAGGAAGTTPDHQKSVSGCCRIGGDPPRSAWPALVAIGALLVLRRKRRTN